MVPTVPGGDAAVPRATPHTAPQTLLFFGKMSLVLAEVCLTPEG